MDSKSQGPRPEAAPPKERRFAKPATPRKRSALRSIATWFFDLFLPLAMALVVYSALASRYPRLYREPILTAFIYAATVTASIVLVQFLSRRIQLLSGTRHLPVRAEESVWARRLRLATVHVIIPLLVALTVALLPISGETVLTRLIRYLRFRGEYAFITNIGNTITSAKSTHTKVAGVRVLQQFGTDFALNETIKSVSSNRLALRDSLFHATVVEAIASFGTKAEPLLLALFEENRQAKVLAEKTRGHELYSEFFDLPFSHLKDRLRLVTDERARYLALLKVREIEQQLETQLNDPQLTDLEIREANVVLTVVFYSLAAIDGLEDHGRSYNLARQVASDVSYDAETRASALAVVAKCGTKDDFEVLLQFLQDPHETVESSALTAMKSLDAKIKGQASQEQRDNTSSSASGRR